MPNSKNANQHADTAANTSTNNRKIAIALAGAGALPPLTPLVAWAHKFYLGQYLWGVVYLVLAATPLSKIVWIACALESMWYLTQSDDSFQARFPMAGSALSAITALGETSSASGEKSAENSLVRILKRSTNRAAAKAEASAQAAQAASQVATALRDLDQLRQEGLITEYEFEQKRRKLLEQIS